MGSAGIDSTTLLAPGPIRHFSPSAASPLAVQWEENPPRGIAYVGPTDRPLYAGEYRMCDTANEFRASDRTGSDADRLFYRSCSRCETCRARYRRRVREVAREGVEASSAPYRYFITLTAPGQGTDLADWNGSHGRRWNHFVTQLRREVRVQLEFFRGCEVQKRGALHDHVVILSAAPITHSTVKRTAVRAGYGYICDLKPLRSDEDYRRTAGYVSKYVTKATGERHRTPWPEKRRHRKSGTATFRTWSRSRGYGVPMAEIRRRAFLRWAASVTAGEDVAGRGSAGRAEPAASVPSDTGPPG